MFWLQFIQIITPHIILDNPIKRPTIYIPERLCVNTIAM